MNHLNPRSILFAVNKHSVLSTRLTPVNARAMCKTCFIIQCVNEPDFTVMNSDGSDSSTSCRFITHAAILRDMAVANICRTAVLCALTRAAVTAVSGAVCLSTEHGFQRSTKTQAKQPWHKNIVLLYSYTVSNIQIRELSVFNLLVAVGKLWAEWEFLAPILINRWEVIIPAIDCNFLHLKA